MPGPGAMPGEAGNAWYDGVSWKSPSRPVHPCRNCSGGRSSPETVGSQFGLIAPCPLLCATIAGNFGRPLFWSHDNQSPIRFQAQLIGADHIGDDFFDFLG